MRQYGPLILLSCLTQILSVGAQQSKQGDDPALVHARKLLRKTPIVDGHNDLPLTIRNNPEAPWDVAAYDLRQRTPGDTDLARLRNGQVGVQFWSVYVPGELQVGFARYQLEQIDIARRMIEHYPDDLAFARNSEDVQAALKQGLIASLLGMEGGHAIENSLGALRAYYRLGARYMTLTHNVTLDWADSAQDEIRHNGLTAFGKEVVREMNRLGMLVDISHVSPKVMSDVLKTSVAPIIFSHSSARALTDHARNVPDSILAKLPANGGVVMVTFIPAFVSQEVADWEKPLKQKLAGISSSEEWDKIRSEYAAKNPAPKATLAQVADHIEHVRKIAGVDHVAIGSDFWGSDDMPVGLEDVSKFPFLIAELIRRGWQDSDLRKLIGQNSLRVLSHAEKVARKLRKSRPPSTETIEKLDKKGL